MPRLMDNEFAESYLEVVDAGTETTTSIINAHFLINVILGTSLKLMWGMVNTLQFISYFSEIQLSMAVQGVVFLKRLKVIALGEFVPYEWITSHLKDKQ